MIDIEFSPRVADILDLNIYHVGCGDFVVRSSNGGRTFLSRETILKLAEAGDAETESTVSDEEVEAALAVQVNSRGALVVETYIRDGGEKYWSPSSWHSGPRAVMRAALEAAAKYRREKLGF